jgi:hypothetical protein
MIIFYNNSCLTKPFLIDLVFQTWCCLGIWSVGSLFGFVKNFKILDNNVFCRSVYNSDKWSTGWSEILKKDVDGTDNCVDIDMKDKVSDS